MGVVIPEPLIPLRRRAVPSILLPPFDDHFVDERLAEAGDLDPGARLHGSTALLPAQPLASPPAGPPADPGPRRSLGTRSPGWTAVQSERGESAGQTQGPCVGLRPARLGSG